MFSFTYEWTIEFWTLDYEAVDVAVFAFAVSAWYWRPNGVVLLFAVIVDTNAFGFFAVGYDAVFVALLFGRIVCWLLFRFARVSAFDETVAAFADSAKFW